MRQTNLLNGNNIEMLRKIPDNVVDSVVTDPPYGLSFMGKKWDYDVPSVEFWKEVYRVLKPGGHVLSFGGTRTYHRMVVNMEDAGFEIRDQIMWLYGSGFPKSMNIGKAIDKKEGNEREDLGVKKGAGTNKFCGGTKGHRPEYNKTKGTSDWEGWGTALKPANEPICVARKPLSEKTVAENVLKWGTGGLNIDGCRVGTDIISTFNEGRWPANVMLDEEAGKALDDKGGASRFFYQAKVSKKERNMGLDDFDDKIVEGRDPGQDERNVAYKPRPVSQKNTHPTVKPIKLMAYLCRLVTPPGGTVLDPFMGSGSTGVAARLEGFRFCGMEMDPDYFEIAKARIDAYEKYRNI